jgi:hypothetical protein
MIGVKSSKVPRSIGIRSNNGSALIGQRLITQLNNNSVLSVPKNDIYENNYTTNSQYIPLGLNNKSSKVINKSNLEKK